MNDAEIDSLLGDLVSPVDSSDELLERLRIAFRMGAERERETCAKIADEHGSDRPDWFGRSAGQVIRERS